MLDETTVIVSDRGRPIRFTAERMDQIKNLVERGHSREDIAAIIGTTVGSLQVTCSKFGISLRRARLDNGVGPKLRRERPPMMNNVIEPPGGWPQKSSFSLKLEFGGRSVDIPIDQTVMATLILDAEIRGLRLGQHVANILQAAIEHK